MVAFYIRYCTFPKFMGRDGGYKTSIETCFQCKLSVDKHKDTIITDDGLPWIRIVLFSEEQDVGSIFDLVVATLQKYLAPFNVSKLWPPQPAARMNFPAGHGSNSLGDVRSNPVIKQEPLEPDHHGTAPLPQPSLAVMTVPDLQHQLSYARAEIAVLRASNHTLASKNQNLMSSIMQKDQALFQSLDALSKKEKELMAAETDIRKAAQALNQATIGMRNTRKNLLAISIVNKRQTLELKAMKRSLRQKNIDLSTAETTIQSLEEKVASVNASLINLGGRAARLASKCARQDDVLARKDEQLASVVAERDQLEEQLCSKEEEYEEQVRAFDNLTQHCDDVIATLEDTTDQLHALQDQLKEINIELESKDDAISELKQREDVRNEEAKDLKKQLAISNASLRSTKAELELVNARMDEERIRKRRRH